LAEGRGMLLRTGCRTRHGVWVGRAWATGVTWMRLQPMPARALRAENAPRSGRRGRRACSGYGRTLFELRTILLLPDRSRNVRATVEIRARLAAKNSYPELHEDEQLEYGHEQYIPRNAGHKQSVHVNRTCQKRFSQETMVFGSLERPKIVAGRRKSCRAFV